MKLQYTFALPEGNNGVITEMFAQGFNYHTYNKDGDVVKGQQYMLKSDFYKDNK
jgi:hypothetical protein